MSDIDVKLKHVSHALYHIPCGVMVSVLALSAVYRGSETRLDHIIKLVFVASSLSKEKNQRLVGSESA